MIDLKNRIEEIKTNGYQLDFGTVFENAFENYKKIAVYAGSMLLLFTFIFGILSSIVLFSFFDAKTIIENLKSNKFNPETLTGEILLIYTVSITLLTCILSPFQAGFLKMADCGKKDEEFRISTIFEYYKAPYFRNIVLSTLIITIVNMGLSTMFNLAGIKSVGSFASLTISLVTLLTVPLIIFGKLNAIEAIQSSIIIVIKQPFLILVLLIIAVLGAFVGLIVFFIGMFFTIPFIYSMEYTIYSSIINTDIETEIKN